MEIRDGRVTLTREELYEQVWTTPMRRLAPAYGLSDVGLKKVCTKYQVPTPPAGYWAKKEFGKRVRQAPLPPLAGEPSRPICLAHDPDPKPRVAPPSSCPVTDPDLLKLYHHEKDPKHRFEVPDHLRDCHPVIRLTRESVSADRKPNLYNHVGPDYRVAPECAAISVARESFGRALRLMNCLFRQLERRGHRVAVRPPRPGHDAHRNRVKCLMLGEEFGFCLREKTRMVRVSEEERRRSRSFVDRVRYEPKGEFELRLTGEHAYALATWSDGRARKIEDQLNTVVVGMLVAVEKSRRCRERRGQEEAARLRREQERRELERLKQMERARAEQLESLAGCWQKAEVLRAYVDAVREEATRRSGQIEPESGLARWLEWAEGYIRSLDPFLSTKLPAIEGNELKVAG